MSNFRKLLTSHQRSIDLELKIDPGFVHQRKIQTIIGALGMEVIDNLISRLPKEIPDWQKNVRIDHIYSDVFMQFCKVNVVQTLEQLISEQKEKLFCSTLTTKKFEKFWEVQRAKIEINLNGDYDFKAFLDFSTERVHGSTLQSRLCEGNNEISVVGFLSEITHEKLTFEPIIMGFPWLVDREEIADFNIMRYHYSYYENYIEDFEEFGKVKDVPQEEDFSILKEIKEETIKKAFGKILKESTFKDWGGETSDFFTTHLHLDGKRNSAAFMFKGPAKFSPMTLNNLGKNNDQIVRLSKEPAQILFVQHCHDILQPVRDTLRAFSVQPGNPKRYCLIDGRDTLRLLKAYNLLYYTEEN